MFKQTITLHSTEAQYLLKPVNRLKKALSTLELVCSKTNRLAPLVQKRFVYPIIWSALHYRALTDVLEQWQQRPVTDITIEAMAPQTVSVPVAGILTAQLLKTLVHYDRLHVACQFADTARAQTRCDIAALRAAYLPKLGAIINLPAQPLPVTLEAYLTQQVTYTHAAKCYGAIPCSQVYHALIGPTAPSMPAAELHTIVEKLRQLSTSQVAV